MRTVKIIMMTYHTVITSDVDMEHEEQKVFPPQPIKNVFIMETNDALMWNPLWFRLRIKQQIINDKSSYQDKMMILPQSNFNNNKQSAF